MTGHYEVSWEERNIDDDFDVVDDDDDSIYERPFKPSELPVDKVSEPANASVERNYAQARLTVSVEHANERTSEARENNLSTLVASLLVAQRSLK